jgi:endogenous inhibitor of DNA gyrase (YacG/DUF329 family)
MNCPICKKPLDDALQATLGQKGSTFPFCSQRCRDIDLARWLDGKYQIPVAEDDQDESGADAPVVPPPTQRGVIRRRRAE